MAFFSGLFAILKTFNILDSYFQDFMVYYFNNSIDKMKKENHDQIRIMFEKHNQIGLETAMNSTNAGQAVQVSNSKIVDKVKL